MSKKIAIIGFGYVGKAMYNFFRNYYNISVYDPILVKKSEYVEEYYPVHDDKTVVNKSAVAVICVPTPINIQDNSCDISIVEEVVGWIETPLILIKSTIPPGTTDMLKEKYKKRIVFSPEFCGESKYWSPYKFDTDVKEIPWFIFGGDNKDTSEIVNIFIKVRVAGPTKTYVQVEAKEAEMTKYITNTFYTAKVVLCHEFANICKVANLDYNKVRELWLLDPRVNRMHTAVFEEEKELAAGGKCFPKDINALVQFSKKMGYEPKLLEEVIKSNKRVKNGSITPP